MKSFSFRTRNQNIEKLKSQHFDLVIIGGGINGAGIARDASMRGLKVALVEQSDFASGTSSRSSKLIHGGIRYLENKEFKLVFEALSERTKLFEMAPHLVHPLRFMIPIYKSSRVGMGLMSLGMWLYDALSLFQAPELHEKLNSQQTKDRVNVLNTNELLGSFLYSDAYMDDDRLVVETMRSASEEGACIASYVKAGKLKLAPNGRVQSIYCEDLMSLEQIEIKCQHIVSCVGAWTDMLGGTFFDNWSSRLRPTKGVHLTFAKNRIPLKCAVVMGAEKSDRIVFAIPRHEMVIIGTTDTDYKEDPSQVSVKLEDVEYLLQVANNYFPGLNLCEADIISNYAGVRPLVKDEASSEGKTSREHEIYNDERGVTFVAGGKYTTYRLIAEQSVNKALEFFSFDQKIHLKKANSQQPLFEEVSLENINKAKNCVQKWSEMYALSLNDVEKLVDRYGFEAENILKKNVNQWGYWQLEAMQAIENGMCFNLTDFYKRRVPLFLSEKDQGLSHLESILEVFINKLGWSFEEAEQQVKNLKIDFEKEMSWKNK